MFYIVEFRDDSFYFPVTLSWDMSELYQIYRGQEFDFYSEDRTDWSEVVKEHCNMYVYTDEGYCIDSYLYKDNKYKKRFVIHRLVAAAFIPNPDNLPQINHKDCNKLNNCVENLEWCNNKYNYEYSLKNGTFSKEFLKYKGNHSLIWKRYYEKKEIAELKDKEPLG